MNAKKLSLSALTLAVLIMLAGCEAQSGDISKDGSAPGKSVTSNAMVTVTGETQTAEVDSTLADQVAYDGARQMLDPTLCEKIINVEKKSQCNKDLETILIQRDAVDKLDPALCERLEPAEIAAACKMKITIAEKQNAADTEFKKQQTSLNEIMAAGDYDKCGSIKDESLFQVCKASAVLHKAVAARDINICGELKDQNLVAGCEQSYKGSPEITTEIINKALAEKNEKLCDALTIEFNIQSCRKAVADAIAAPMQTSTQQE